MAHKDIPSRGDIDLLAAVREPNCVSIYTPAGPLPEDGERARIELKNQLREVLRQLESAQVDKDQLERVKESVETLLQDALFWQYQSDRKSTRLNSSHVAISYAVFCLKKKKN